MIENQKREEKYLQKIDSLKEILQELESFKDRETLVVFDVDFVLTQSIDPVFHLSNILKHRPTIKQLTQGLHSSELDRLHTYLVAHHEMALVEHHTPEIIAHIQNSNIKCLALTAMLTGGIGNIPDLPSWRSTFLQNKGIDFSKSFPHVKKHIFQEIPSYLGKHAQYLNGILFSNGEREKSVKGETLKAFLKLVDWMPEVVFCIDDKVENLVGVHNALQRETPSLEYKGFHYLGAAKIPSQPVSTEECRHKWSAGIREEIGEPSAV